MFEPMKPVPPVINARGIGGQDIPARVPTATGRRTRAHARTDALRAALPRTGVARGTPAAADGGARRRTGSAAPGGPDQTDQATSIRRLLALVSALLGARISRTPSRNVAVTLASSTSNGSFSERLNAPAMRSSRW